MIRSYSIDKSPGTPTAATTMSSKLPTQPSHVRWNLHAPASESTTREPLSRQITIYIAGLAIVLVALTAIVLFDLFPHEYTTGSIVLIGALLSVGFTLLIRLFQAVREISRTSDTNTTEPLQPRALPLEILYDISAAINASRDLDDLLERFMQTLQPLFDAHAVTIRLTTDEGDMHLLASQGLHREVLKCEELLAVQNDLWDKTIKKGSILLEHNLQPCSEILKTTSCNKDSLCMISVPVRHFSRVLGVYTLFVDNTSFAVQNDLKPLLTNIGRHLGIAIEKSRLDEHAHHISIKEERNRLAQELHDSLAQSLASLRFQVRVLDETLHQGNESALWQELEKIENSLDEANIELREMINNFRAPVHEQGFLPALGKLITRFRSETSIHVYLQNEWSTASLPKEVEIQVLRIIQETFANIRKHSKAQHVRLLLSGSADDHYRVLVEDDGIGIGDLPHSSAGEHIGLSIMQERAKRLGGELRIESERGEGTQVTLVFHCSDNDGTADTIT